MNDTLTPAARLADRLEVELLALRDGVAEAPWGNEKTRASNWLNDHGDAILAALRDHAAQDRLAALVNVASAAQNLVGSVELGERHVLTLAAASKVNKALAALAYPVDEDGLIDFRAALTGSPATPAEHVHDWKVGYGVPTYCADCGIEQRATPTPRPVADGLDVERLAQAMTTVYDEDLFFRRDGLWATDAHWIAREYDRLAAARSDSAGTPSGSTEEGL